MKHQPITQLILTCAILPILLTTSGCINLSKNLMDKATDRQFTEVRNDTLDQVTAAYVTDHQELIVCIRGLYEGKPPVQEYAFRIPMQTLKNEAPTSSPDTMIKSQTVPRDQVVLGCPYRHKPATATWKSVKVQTLPNTLTIEQQQSLRPLPETSETVYEMGHYHANKQVIYTTTLEEYHPVTLLQSDFMTVTHIEKGQPLLYLLVPFAAVADVVGNIVVGIVLVPAILIFCHPNSCKS